MTAVLRPGVPTVKTAVPRPSPNYVPRSRLLLALDAAAEGQVTLVSAPAGYGKTLLLAEWAALVPERTAWVSLDQDDNSDRRFWAAVLAALGTCTAVPVDNALREVTVPGHPSRDPEFLAVVADAIATAPGPLRLVLDDVHELTAPDPLHGLASLVRDRSPALHLVLSARTDPPLPLARMRLAGELCEIRAEDLRFSVAEAGTMLAAADVPVRPDQLHLLVEETEGWAAGLRLAALSLREADDPDEFLAGFVGSGRAVSDYLVGEILSRLTGRTRDLLRAVCVCDQLSAPLAAALSGREDAGVVLDSLERETALVLSTGEDRRWYRVHPLLRSHLRADLQRQRPDLIVALHGRAADWYATAGQPDAALAHARHAGDHGRIARLLRRQATALIADGEHGVVRAALDRLGDARIGGDPLLALLAALVATESGDVAAADHHLAAAASSWPSDPPPDLLALRGLVRSRREIVAGDDPIGRPPTADLAGPGAVPDPELAPMALVHDAVGLLAEHRLDEARATAEAGLAHARRQHHTYLVALGLVTLAAIAAAEGDYRRMSALAAAADAELADPVRRATIGAAWSATMRGYGALLRADPAACLDLVSADVPDAPAPTLPGRLRALRAALRGAALSDIGHGADGLTTLRDARAMVAGGPGAAQIPATVALLEHRTAAGQGHGTVARAVLKWAEDELGPVGEVFLLRARQLAGLGRPAAASHALDRLLDGTAPAVLPWTIVEGRVLGCQLALRGGRRPQARRELDRALEMSEAMDVLRPLVLGPPEVIDLLTRHMGGFGDREPTAVQVLAARAALGAGIQPVPLTERERAVLTMLPTQRSFDEIASDLTVSHSTVKTHVRALYGKLGVTSRRDAVATARSRGILAPEA